MAHLRAVPDPDDEPGVGRDFEAVDPVVDQAVEPAGDPAVDPAAAVAPGEDDEPTRSDSTESTLEDEPRRYPSTIGGAFYICILVVAGVALVIAVRSDWRLGIQILGSALILAALLRLVLANRDAGMLAVRNRFLDAFLLTGAGAALIALASSIPDMPLT